MHVVPKQVRVEAAIRPKCGLWLVPAQSRCTMINVHSADSAEAHREVGMRFMIRVLLR